MDCSRLHDFDLTRDAQGMEEEVMTTLRLAFPTPSGLPGSIASTERRPVRPPLDHIDTIPAMVVVEQGDEEIRIYIDSHLTDLRWLPQTVQDMAGLSRLQDGWNSYGGKRIQARAIEKMLETLISILEPNTPAPAVVPTSEGGVQVEWHLNGIDLEIEVTRMGDLEYYYNSAKKESEGSLTDPSTLRRFVRLLGTKSSRE